MSFLPINEENQQAPTGATSNAPISAPPPQTSGSAGSAGSTPKTATTGTPTQFGSSASKLGDYLSANAPQITNQANTIAGNLNQTYGNVSQGITNAANQFGQQVQGGYAAGNPDLITQAMQNPATFASDPNNVKGFQSQYNDTYTGPLAFEGTSPYSDIQNQVSQAVQQGNLLGTTAGLQSYLQGQGPNPSRASATLDALLLQGNPDAQATIQNAANQLGTLQGQFQTATSGANALVPAAQQAAQNAQAYAQGQFNPFVQQFGTSLNDQLAAANANRDAYNKAIIQNQTGAQDLRSALVNAYPGALSKAVGQTGNLGNPATDAAEKARITALLTPGYNSAVSSLAPYLSGQPITQSGILANVATAPQYAEDAALSTLLGQAYNPYLNQGDAAQAGTYQIPNLPGALPTTGPEVTYLNDLASLYGNPAADYWNAGGGAPGGTTLTPAQQAQMVVNQNRPGTGINLDANSLAALQRLIGGETGYGG